MLENVCQLRLFSQYVDIFSDILHHGVTRFVRNLIHPPMKNSFFSNIMHRGAFLGEENESPPILNIHFSNLETIL